MFLGGELVAKASSRAECADPDVSCKSSLIWPDLQLII